MRVDPAELRWRMVDELATNDYVIPHLQSFLPWRSAFLAIPQHALISDTVWVKNGAGLGSLHRTDDPQRWLDLTYADDSVITQVDDGHPVGPGLIGEARFAYNTKGQQSYARAYRPFPSAAQDSRKLLRTALEDWRMSELYEPGALILTEMVL